MKTDESPSEAEKEEQKAEASTNTNGKQQERRAFWEKGNRDVYRTGHLSFFSQFSHQVQTDPLRKSTRVLSMIKHDCF